jgi:hypothetical protein
MAVGDTVTSLTRIQGKVWVWVESRVDAEQVDEYGETQVTASTPLRWAIRDLRPAAEQTARPPDVKYATTDRGDVTLDVKSDLSPSDRQIWVDVEAAEKRDGATIKVTF